MILLDTGPIVAFFDGSDHYQSTCVTTLQSIEDALITTWPVLTEAFYLLGFSWKAQDNLWRFIIRGGMEIFPIGSKLQLRCRGLMEKYKDLPMDLADAAIVAFAEFKKIRKVFILDHKDFAEYRFSKNQTFQLLPSKV